MKKAEAETPLTKKDLPYEIYFRTADLFYTLFASLFSYALPLALSSIFPQKPFFFFCGVSSGPRIPRTPVM